MKEITDLVFICEKLRQKCNESSALSCDCTTTSKVKRTLSVGILTFMLFDCMYSQWFERPFRFLNWFSACAFSPRDLPVLCKWRDWLRLWSRLVVTRGDGLRSAAWMGKAWLVLEFLCCKTELPSSHPLLSPFFIFFPFFIPTRGLMTSMPVTQWSLWFSSSVQSVSSTAQPGPRTWFPSWGRWAGHNLLSARWVMQLDLLQSLKRWSKSSNERWNSWHWWCHWWCHCTSSIQMAYVS